MLLDQHVSGETEETLEIPQNRLFARQCSNPGPSEHEVGVVKYYLLRNVRWIIDQLKPQLLVTGLSKAKTSVTNLKR